MFSNGYNVCGDLQHSRSDSVIKMPRSCCLKIDTEIAYQDKLKTDIQLTHQDFMMTESENSSLNSKINDLETRLNGQNYKYTCLKYQLEQINREKCGLITKINEIPAAPFQNNFKVVDYSTAKVVPEEKMFRNSSSHAADKCKLPEIFCLCGVQLKSVKCLRNHIRYHKFKTNFTCKICAFKTNGMSLLKSHMKKRHDINYVPESKECVTCGYLFDTLEQLHEHRRREQ